MAPTPPPVEAGRLLLVEDDAAVRNAVERGLRLDGFTVSSVGDGEAALDAVATHRPDLAIIDVGLPGMSGVDLCARLRQLGLDLPLLILSARDQVEDRVAGLEAGADDYVVKPFDLRELTARLRALLRRRRADVDTTVATCGPLWMDLDRRTASLDGDPVALSRREFDLLAALCSNAGIVLSRVRLLELVWGYDFDTDTNVVDVFVGYLRRKLEANGTARMIQTVRGVGFVLRAP